MRSPASGWANQRRRWEKVTETPAPAALNGLLLDAALAYEIQCKEHGGLTLADRKRLAKAGRPPPQRSNAEDARRKSVAVTHRRQANTATSFAIGTQFIREWNNRDEIVTVVDGGFMWNGIIHGSLSAAARAITGTRWNGPRFFGLTTKRAKS